MPQVNSMIPQEGVEPQRLGRGREAASFADPCWTIEQDLKPRRRPLAT